MMSRISQSSKMGKRSGLRVLCQEMVEQARLAAVAEALAAGVQQAEEAAAAALAAGVEAGRAVVLAPGAAAEMVGAGACSTLRQDKEAWEVPQGWRRQLPQAMLERRGRPRFRRYPAVDMVGRPRAPESDIPIKVAGARLVDCLASTLARFEARLEIPAQAASSSS